MLDDDLGGQNRKLVEFEVEVVLVVVETLRSRVIESGEMSSA